MTETLGDQILSPPAPSKADKAPRIAGILAILIGLIVLTGWAADLEPLKRLAPSLVAMNPTTACCFVMSGIALILIHRRTDALPVRIAIDCLAGIIGGIGIVKFIDLMAGVDSGIDRMVFASKLIGPQSLNINSMAPNTALNMALTGIAIFCASRRHPRLVTISQICTLLTVLLASMAVIGYAYGAFGFYRFRSYFPMALHTAIAFIIVSIGLLATHPRHGIMAIITSPYLGGITARVLVPGLIITPFVLGLLWLIGLRTESFDPIAAVALFVTGNITVLVAIVLEAGRRLNRTSASLANRSIALEEANRIAYAAGQAKSDFLANMSHEIRTPMNGVVGMLEVLEYTSLTDEQNRIVATIRGSARSLLEVINDILDFSKIEAGHLKVEIIATDLVEIMESTTRLFLGAAAAKGLGVRCFVGPSIRGRFMTDPVRVRQILSNLVSNAVKFTREGGVTLTAESIAQDDGPPLIRIIVADTGIGISPEAQTRLFRPFVQADETTARKYGGTGLGLSICLRLADLLGGEITLQSAEGTGTRVTLTLPAAPAGENMPLLPELEGLRVALIAADSTEEQYLADYLRYWGAEVTATPLKNRRRYTIGTQFDLVLAPLEMAVQARLATIGANAIPVGPPKRFVFYSHSDDPTDRAQSATDAIVTSALSRARIVTAVAVAAGRKSPDIELQAPVSPTRPKRAAPNRADALRDGRLVLLAEDHPVNRDVIVRQLTLLGYAVDTAGDGLEALAALKQNSYGLLLTDCNMPNMDGFDLVRTIRQEEMGARHLPIVALTANAMEGEAERCLAAGMDDYLSKPVEMSVLDNCLKRWLTGDRPAAPDDELQAAALKTKAPPILDLAALIENADGDEEVRAATLQLFLQSLTVDLAALADAMQAEDLSAVALIAHRIKGAARMVGALALAAASEAVEAGARAADLAAARTHQETLTLCGDELAQHIARL
jgi:signal transduction histidine kinase/CheY-like chemotaxis protein